ncbi:YjfB family protein [Salicola sp. Rm-C-2C1-2]|uniref:YjfB family protein n=1 Tax=Salicola sp. Rm-C-2C1-2 TaxID=3141321 RepID=UPI0032E4B3FE
MRAVSESTRAASAVSTQSQANLQQDVQINLQKKQMEMQEANASQLLTALSEAGGVQDPAAGSANPPEAVGGTVNVSS